MIFATSVRRYLLATMVAISAPAIGTLGYLGYAAVSDIRTNHRLAGLVEADRALLITGNAIRSDRGKVQTSLQAQDDPLPTIRSVVTTGQNQIATALSKLNAADLAERGTLGAAITKAQKAMEARIGDLDAEAAKPKAQRSLAATMPWYDAVGDIEAGLTKASAAASLAVRLEDPVLAELQAIKAAGWQMRSNYGLQCSVLRPALGSGQNLTPPQMQRFGELRGASNNAQTALTELVSRPGIPAALASKVATANQQVSAANQAMDQLVGKLGQNAGPVIAAQDWTGLCNKPFTAIVDAVTQSLDEMLVTTTEQSSQAMTRLALIGGLLLALLGLCLLSWRGVRKRLANPLVSMNAALGADAGRRCRRARRRRPLPRRSRRPEQRARGLSRKPRQGSCAGRAGARRSGASPRPGAIGRGRSSPMSAMSLPLPQPAISRPGCRSPMPIRRCRSWSRASTRSMPSWIPPRPSSPSRCRRWPKAT